MQLPRDFSNISLITCDVFDTLLIRDSITPDRLWMRKGMWFSIARPSSEFIARVSARFQHKKEIEIASIYKLLPKRWNIESEISLEIGALRLNPEIAEWLREASAAGVRVVLISDIYFSVTQLSKIIAAIGGPTYEIVTSSDEGITKSTGLFRILQKRWNVAPNAWLHVGDNQRADVDVPSKLGIGTFHYPKLLDQILNEGVLSKRGADALLKADADGEKLITGLSLQFARFMADNKDISKNIAELVGGLICAPIAKAIAEYVRDVAKTKGSQVIWFSGRDGWLPFLFFERENCELASAYFQVSRIAIESPNFQAYLGHMFQEHNNILIFDVGWRGSLLNQLKVLHPEISWQGAFLALIPAEKAHESAMARRFSKNWFSLVKNRDLIETLFSDPTPGVKSYDATGTPVLKSESDELNQSLRHSILKGANWAGGTFTQELNLDLALKLARVTSSYPSRELAERFLAATHEIVKDRRKLFVVNTFRDLFREKDLSWWAGTHALTPTNPVAGVLWDLTLYIQELYVLASRTIRRYLIKGFH